MPNHKKFYEYKGEMLTLNELSDICGYTIDKLRNRMWRGFSIEQAMQDFPRHDSVIVFDEASNWKDWIGLTNRELYDTYYQWCLKHELPIVTHNQLMQELLPLYNLQVVSTQTRQEGYAGYIRQKQCRSLLTGRCL